MGEGPKNSLPPPGQLPGGAEIGGGGKMVSGGGRCPPCPPPESGPEFRSNFCFRCPEGILRNFSNILSISNSWDRKFKSQIQVLIYEEEVRREE